ncbi:MAG: UbiA family prenyltransferase [Bacteroidota bacterium]
MISAKNLQLLRLPFSFFLLPVFLFALSGLQTISCYHALLLFTILHLLVYPASNAYNSFMDQDEGPIGGLKHPPKADKKVFYLSAIMDTVAVLLSLLLGLRSALFVLMYILISRAYSYKRIRLKKFALAGYLTVVIFQGAWIYMLTCHSAGNTLPDLNGLCISSLLIAGVYPLTQIYQHDADRKDGVHTMSMMLGYRGTFLLTAICFVCAMILFYIRFQESLWKFWLLQGLLSPVLIYFFYWLRNVWENVIFADFTHTMRMNALASVLLNLFFLSLIISNIIQ